MKIGKLFVGLSWCNGKKDEAVVMSWSRKCGYWRWAIWWRKPKTAFCIPAFGPSMASGTKYHVGHGSFGAWARLPLIGSLSISGQPRYPGE